MRDIPSKSICKYPAQRTPDYNDKKQPQTLPNSTFERFYSEFCPPHIFGGKILQPLIFPEEFVSARYKITIPTLHNAFTTQTSPPSTLAAVSATHRATYEHARRGFRSIQIFWIICKGGIIAVSSTQIFWIIWISEQ